MPSKRRFLNPTTVGAVAFAFFVWGAWAYVVNRHSGSEAQALRSGVTQGLYSGVMTFYMSFSVYFFWKKTAHLNLSSVLPTLATVGHTGAALILVHFLNHTPNIAKTVAAPLTVATLYCLFLTRKFQYE